MKRKLLTVLFCCFAATALCQTKYWQQKVDCKITVSLDDQENSLTGYESMDYYNNSPDTLRFIWIHLWANAYKNDLTAFSDQLLQNGSTEFYFSEENRKGYVNQLDFKVDKKVAVVEDHPRHRDIVKVILPEPLAPGSRIKIETPFHVKLPYNISRGGHIDQSYMATQWYPKPAVYDRKGWHEMPYLDRGEFYSEFGTFDVEITTPEDYIIAATGNLKNERKENGIKTLNYVQENVHDFAWFADKNFILLEDTLMLASHIVKVKVFHLADEKGLWTNSAAFTKNAIRQKSGLVGEYPYDVVSVVDNAAQVPGGMEYPTITLLRAGKSERSLDEVIHHEVGHNWFYGILASNERRYPWMDEGMNDYYDNRYVAETYSDGSKNPSRNSFFANRIPDDITLTALAAYIKIKKDQPISTSSENFSQLNYGLIAYSKAGAWMKLLETELGRETFDRLMREYYARWKFKHPYPEDFKSLAEDISQKNLDSLFSLLDAKGPLMKTQNKKIVFTSFFNLRNTDRKHFISVAPAIGVNYYDKLMIGGIIHNYNLPPSDFQFFAAPLYATGTNKINGLAQVSYTLRPGSNGAALSFSMVAAKFTGGSFTDSLNDKNPLQFKKLVPSVKYVFANKSALSQAKKYIQLKSFLISETGILFSRDFVNNIDIIKYPEEERYVNQLQFVFQNKRVLYPYDAAFQAEQGKGFARLNVTGNYFFNYAKGGGLNVRLFAGKFFYTGDKTFLTQFENDRYHLNMSGPKGYEDYTYSNYFVGRSEFEGLSSQQIMQRDGFFKVRTDLLSSKIGKTDDWLAAINFTTDVPKNINPLSLLPVKIPLRLFADIGTYAEAFDKSNVSGKFLYDAGLQLSIFKSLINIYVPLAYSKVYRDYFKSTIEEKRFLKNISFSIDVQQLFANRLLPYNL